MAQQVLNSDIQFIDKMPEIMGKPQVKVQVWVPPTQVREIHDDFQKRTGSNKVITWRLFIPYYFLDFDKVLYLDNDLIITTDVNEIFNQFDSKYTVAAVKDFYYAALPAEDYRREPAQKRMNLADDSALNDYYNAGVLLFNSPKFRQENDPDHLIHILNETTSPLTDQAILNQLTYRKTQFLPWRYNYQNQPDNLEYQGKLDAKVVESIVADYPLIKIRHFAGVPLSAPYEHIQVQNKWELEFWRALLNVKRLSSIPEP